MTEARPELTIRPFEGTVTVRFLEAVLASSRNALLVGQPGREEQVFIPFEDIYFDFLTRSDSVETCPVKGEAGLWTIQAVGRAEPDAMRAYGANEASARLKHYGVFDPAKVAIEMTQPDAPVA